MRCSFPTYASSDDPYVIWPRYTGRDKGAAYDGNGELLTFFTDGWAWKYIFETLQPNDDRACSNYRVLRLSEYRR